MGFAARWAFDRLRLDRFMPRRTANIAGFGLVALALLIVTRDGVLDPTVNALDRC